MRVSAYSDMPPEDVGLVERITLLEQAINNSDGDVFVAPEYFWGTAPIIEAQQRSLLRALVKISKKNPEKLIVPGSMVWRDEAQVVRNSTFVLADGSVLSDAQGEQRYDKADLDYEYREMRGLTWQSGAVPHFDVMHRGWLVRVQICSDNGTFTQASSPDLAVVPCSRIGSGFNSTATNGSTIFADSDGRSWQLTREPSAARPVERFLPPELKGKFLTRAHIPVLKRHVPEEVLKAWRPSWFT